MSNTFVVFLACVLGVFFSILLHVLRQALPQPKAVPAGAPAFFPRFWEIARPYVILGLFSILVSVLLVAFLKDSLTDWRAGVLAGYAASAEEVQP